jgi:hypothetical protein
MYKGSGRLVALIVVYLIFPIPAANAQIEATGDVWSSREEPVYVPQRLWSCQMPLRQVTLRWPPAMCGHLERNRCKSRRRPWYQII